MLIKKALEFDCADELAEWIGETHKNGLFLDDVSLTYLLANLNSEELKLQICITAGKSGNWCLKAWLQFVELNCRNKSIVRLSNEKQNILH